jgi:hypothetical protein
MAAFFAALPARFSAPSAAAPRRGRRATPCRAAAADKPAAPKEWTDKATVAGGGFSGACDIAVRGVRRHQASNRIPPAGLTRAATQVVKQAIDECAGLEGERLKACWASNGAQPSSLRVRNEGRIPLLRAVPRPRARGSSAHTPHPAAARPRLRR